ncbi:MAG: succinate dehydrogenase cytochrome b subunit [Acidobacteriota bacterium]
MRWIISYYGTTIGKKVFMAVTGLCLFGFVLVHMIGNLQVYAGQARLDAYAAFLAHNEKLLWVARLALLLLVALHIIAAVQVWWRNRGARPVEYRGKADLGIDYAARTMVWSGPIIAAFVLYHLFHFTWGTVHPSYIVGAVYHNVVTGFQVPWVAAFYIIANFLLAVHLYHGLWSWFQTLGLEHPRYNALRRVFAVGLSVLIGIGNISIPLSVLTGLVRE